MSDFSVSEEGTRKAFVPYRLAKSVALETFVHCFQIKILNDILFYEYPISKHRKDSK